MAREEKQGERENLNDTIAAQYSIMPKVKSHAFQYSVFVKGFEIPVFTQGYGKEKEHCEATANPVKKKKECRSHCVPLSISPSGLFGGGHHFFDCSELRVDYAMVQVYARYNASTERNHLTELRRKKNKIVSRTFAG